MQSKPNSILRIENVYLNAVCCLSDLAAMIAQQHPMFNKTK